jgi:hypothetical protein
MKPEIKFNNRNHTYIRNGVEYISVTTLISKYFSEFDIAKIAKFKAFKSRREGIKGQGVRYWKALWKKNREYGSEVHKEIQDYLNTRIQPISDEAIHAITWLHNLERTISKSYTMPEVVLFNDKYKIAGTADIIIYESDTNNMFVIDWKVVNEIKTEGYNNKKSKLGMNDCNFWKYALQLNMYAWILRQNGYNTPNPILIQLTPDGIKEFKIPGIIEEIDKILKDREEELK